MKRLNTINDAFEYTWKTITQIAEAALMGHERSRRSAEVEPLEFVTLSQQSPACSVNKVNLQSISRNFFAEMSQSCGMTVVLSSCVTDIDGLCNCEMLCGDAHSLKPELNSEIEKADPRLIPHIQNAVLDGSAKIIVSSTDTDVLVLLVHYLESLSDQVIEVWNLFRAGDHARYIPVHMLVQNLGKYRASSLLAASITSSKCYK